MELRNTYYLIRHGQALSNIDGFYSSWPEKINNPLTPKGRKDAEAAGEALKDKNISYIFSSDLLRTKQTAEIIAQKLNLEVTFDIRLRELDFGIFNGKPAEYFDHYFKEETDRLERAVPEGETYLQVRERVLSFIEEIDKNYKGNMLIVSHECPIWILKAVVKEVSMEDFVKKTEFREKIPHATIIKLNI